jgi:1,4-dihydroxy-6-naphthoate synthase
MGDGYGPMLVAKQKFSREQIARKKIAVPGTMTSAFLALQLWSSDEPPQRACRSRGNETQTEKKSETPYIVSHRSKRPSTFNLQPSTFDYVIVPFDQIFKAVRSGAADAGLIIHEGQLTYANEGLVVCEDLGVWWGQQNDGLPLPLGGNAIHKRLDPATRKIISDILTASIRYSLDHRAEAVEHAMQFARDMGRELADKFVGMYVNHWTLDCGERGREAIRRFLGRAFERGLIPRPQELEFVM